MVAASVSNSPTNVLTSGEGFEKTTEKGLVTDWFLNCEEKSNDDKYDEGYSL